MCGIVGYVGKDKNALHILIDGLKTLEYRGYDSAGIAIFQNNDLNLIKSVGRIVNLEEKLDYDILSDIGIGHTRWATHGSPNEANCHPHKIGDITIVHNGIIENYEEIKKELNNYIFNSNTDTEIACALIDSLYAKHNDIIKALIEFQNQVRGSYALGIIINNQPDRIYAVRKDSPLILATGENGNYIASDVCAISKYSNSVLYLEEGIIAKIDRDTITLYDKAQNIVGNKFITLDMIYSVIDKNGYEHYMLKEINEQPRVFKDTIYEFTKNGIESLLNMPDLSVYNKIDIVACGSAYHTGLVGKHLLEKYADILVNVDIASEYRYRKNFYDKKTLVILVSQSGETADTLAVLRKAKSAGIDTLAIVNVSNSTIMREAKYSLVVKAGPEIAVATTKAYLAQITMFILITLNLAYKKKTVSEKEIEDLLNTMPEMENYFNTTLNNKDYKKLAEKIYEEQNIFFIGRGIDYALAMEGSLKLKEISYISSQAYPAGELKHGTISLIDNGTVVIAILTDDVLAEKTISNIKEVKARGAQVILISNNDYNDCDFYDYKLIVPKTSEVLQSLLTIIPLQLLAYEVARMRKCDIDKPKNLAKSVTVE